MMLGILKTVFQMELKSPGLTSKSSHSGRSFGRKRPFLFLVEKIHREKQKIPPLHTEEPRVDDGIVTSAVIAAQNFRWHNYVLLQ